MNEDQRAMKEQEAQQNEAMLDSLLGEDENSTLAALVTELTTISGEITEKEKRKDELKLRIISTLDGMGASSVKVAGRRIGFTERTYYGIDREQVQAAKEWMEKVAPEANIPAAANIGKAVEAFLDDNPGVAVPAFITSTKTRILTNAKA